MDRKNFIKKSLIAGLAGAVLPTSSKAKESSTSNSTYDKLLDQIEN